MQHLDLLDLRDAFNRQNIMICFNGPFSRSIIEELGTAIRRYMENDAVAKGAMSDVFGVFVEQTQNVRNYVTSRYPEDHGRQSAIVIIAKDQDGYVVSSGNMIQAEDADQLTEKLADLQAMDKTQLKAVYKEQMRRPRGDGVTGAGLGLIDMARKAKQPLAFAVKPMADGQAFFSLRVVI